MSLKNKALTGVVWTFAQQFGNQLINFIVSIFLARLLLPSEFGLIGMISVFIGVGNTLLNSGLTNSLIRSKELDEDDYSTVFFYNLGVSIILYLIIYFSAPSIAEFYDQNILIGIIRLYCLSFIIAAFMAVQQAKMTKEMNFKSQTFISLPSLVIGGVVGIILAINDFGVWSLVWSHLIMQTLSSLQFWFYSGWIPILDFNKVKFREHFNFGYKMALSSLIGKIFKNSYPILIGKFFSPAVVGFYTRAVTMRDLPVGNISLALNKVTYPLFSAINHDNVKLRSVFSRLMKMVVFVVTPVLLISGILSEPIFRLLLTEKWLPAVPYFQILCMAGVLYPVNMYNVNVLLVKGRSDITLKLTLINNVILVIILVASLKFGITGLLIAQVIHSVISFLLNAYYTNKFIKYNAWEQFVDLLPIFLLNVVTGIVVFIGDKYLENYHDVVRISLGVIIGVIFYLGISRIFKFNSLIEITRLIPKK